MSFFPAGMLYGAMRLQGWVNLMETSQGVSLFPCALVRVPAPDEHPSGNEYTERESSRPQLR